MTKAALTSYIAKWVTWWGFLTAYWLAPVAHNLASLDCSLPPNLTSEDPNHNPNRTDPNRKEG